MKLEDKVIEKLDEIEKCEKEIKSLEEKIASIARTISDDIAKNHLLEKNYIQTMKQ